MSITPFLSHQPDIHPTVFVAPGACIMGAVTIAENASIWYQCVLRADIERITVGPRSNLQDGVIVHLSSDLGTHVGADVTCGHRAILHACTIGDEVLVGMGAIVMDGARIGPRCIIGAGSLVTRGFEAPEGSLVVGSPARVIRTLDLEDRHSIRKWAAKYVEVAREHQALRQDTEDPAKDASGG